MPFKRFVQTGRVALIADGPKRGKLVSIVDVIDQTRVLVDGPTTGVPRTPIRMNQLHLTKFCVKYPFTAPTRVVRKAWTEAKVEEKFNESVWAQKMASKEKRLELSDFDRFKLRKARSRRNRIRAVAYFNLKKTNSRNGTLYGKKAKAKGGDGPKTKKGAAPAKKEAKKGEAKKGKK